MELYRVSDCSGNKDSARSRGEGSCLLHGGPCDPARGSHHEQCGEGRREGVGRCENLRAAQLKFQERGPAQAHT